MEKIDDGFWHEYVEFNGWYYGTSKEQFYNTCNLFIMTPIGLSHINDTDRKNTLVIYLDIPENIRRERLIQRHMPGDTLERRIAADENDFIDFNNYDVKISNYNF